MLCSTILVVLSLQVIADQGSPPPTTDYMDMLGQDDIQNKKSGFMAGNKVYYIGGKYFVWTNGENETIGLTHPFFHDLRSRGMGIEEHTGVGTGNDFNGWDFYVNTKVLYGSVVADQMRWTNPAPTRMFWRPDKMIVEYELSNSSAGVTPVKIREEKFIAANDVVSTTITADRPVTLEFTGRSYAITQKSAASRIIKLDGKCSFDKGSNMIRVIEGGQVRTKVSEKPEVIVPGKLVYDGMSGVISASRSLENVTLYDGDHGVCGYNFSVPVDSSGVTLSWTMNDDYPKAKDAVHEVLGNPSQYMTAKTSKMNDLLNNVVPYFRCSDNDIVKIYYYLWSIQLMYYTQGDSGMQVLPHTQTAVNNFLGMHRYDAMLQIRAGAWTSPAQHDFYANGNALVWNLTLPYAVKGQKEWQLSDNFGIGWVSGVQGTAVAHICGAWQIYEHSGNQTFLKQAYDFYKYLYWGGIDQDFFGWAFDSVLCLNKMAEVLGHPEDMGHWDIGPNSTVIRPVHDFLYNQWEEKWPNMWGSSNEKYPDMPNVAVMGMSMFPREWAEKMAEHWLNDPVKGFNGKVPLTNQAMGNWPEPNQNFATTPDGNFLMLQGLYLHNVDKFANKFYLGHLKTYNMEWGIPVAPETRDQDGKPHGDQYSNFNAGKIVLLLEGLGGLKYSINDDSFTFADSLPTNWTFMEFRVPVVQKPGAAVTWVKARAERQCNAGRVTKTVTVDSNPFKSLNMQPWDEDASVESSSPSGVLPTTNSTIGHVAWLFNASSGKVTLTLKSNADTACSSTGAGQDARNIEIMI